MKLRIVLGLFLGVVAPLAYWLGLWLETAPVGMYLEWFYSLGLPELELVMRGIIPWGSIHLGIILYNNRLYRRLLGPAMFLIVVTGNAIWYSFVVQAVHTAWGDGETTIAEITMTTITFTLSSLHYDAIPAATATLLGMCLSRRRDSLAPTETT